MKLLTETQHKALELVERARVADVAVEVAGKTRGTPPSPTIRRATAVGLMQLGLVRFSVPEGRFALITGRGRALLGAGEGE
jgi:uncharacterized membrane protein